MTLTAGTPIGKYVVKKKLAEGGMAEIYLCKSVGPQGFEKEVVIKRIRPFLASDQKFVEMFINEAQLASRLNHANIVQIFDFDKHEDTYYLAMEYVHGRSLWELRRKCKELMQPLPATLVAHVGAEVARGLHYAHRLSNKGRVLGIVHRDVTPHNVLLSFDGAVKLTDFGIAKADTSVTAPGVLKGKFAYMSPEQSRGDAVDARTDIFALGIVLWEMLTGGRLFDADNEIAVLRAVQQSQIPPPSRINPDVPEALSDRILKALQRDVSQRYQTAQELERELKQFVINHAEHFEDTDVGGFLRGLFPEDATSVRGIALGDASITPNDPPSPGAAPREKTAVQSGAGSLPPRPAAAAAQTNVLSRGSPKTEPLPAVVAKHGVPRGPITDPAVAALAATSVRPENAAEALAAPAPDLSAPPTRQDRPQLSASSPPPDHPSKGERGAHAHGDDATQIVRGPGDHAAPEAKVSPAVASAQAPRGRSRVTPPPPGPSQSASGGAAASNADAERATQQLAPATPVPRTGFAAVVRDVQADFSVVPATPQASSAGRTPRGDRSSSRGLVVAGAVFLIGVGIAVAVGMRSARSSDTVTSPAALPIADVKQSEERAVPSALAIKPPTDFDEGPTTQPAVVAQDGGDSDGRAAAENQHRAEVPAVAKPDAGQVVAAVADAGANVAVKRVAAKRKGVLRVAVSPWAKVIIDGVGRGDIQTPRQFPLDVGEHRVRLEHPRGNRERRVVIQAGKTFTLTVNMLAEDDQ